MQDLAAIRRFAVVREELPDVEIRLAKAPGRLVCGAFFGKLTYPTGVHISKIEIEGRARPPVALHLGRVRLEFFAVSVSLMNARYVQPDRGIRV